MAKTQDETAKAALKLARESSERMIQLMKLIAEDVLIAPSLRMEAMVKVLEYASLNRKTLFNPLNDYGDIVKMSHEEGMSLIMNKLLAGEMAVEDARVLREMLDARQLGKFDNLEREMAELRKIVEGGAETQNNIPPHVPYDSSMTWQ